MTIIITIMMITLIVVVVVVVVIILYVHAILHLLTRAPTCTASVILHASKQDKDAGRHACCIHTLYMHAAYIHGTCISAGMYAYTHPVPPTSVKVARAELLYYYYY